ncbi:hypothetical protein ACQKCH_03815 [Nubsella zeaxanthinifaciens]|uniref:hypothetical protein n=1 Tax=Nubsella zeaxanthinifaciens TaxID=392412 RepID=UPI003D060419
MRPCSSNQDKRLVSDFSLGAIAHLLTHGKDLAATGTWNRCRDFNAKWQNPISAGLSFMGSRENSIGISLGSDWAVSGRCALSGRTSLSDCSSTSVPTVDHLKGVWCAGISYNLLSTRKKTDKLD